MLEDKKILAERVCQDHTAAVSEAVHKVILVEQDRIALRMTKAREVMCAAHDSLKHLSMVWIPKTKSQPNQSALQPIPFSMLARAELELSEPIAGDFKYRQHIDPRSISLDAWNQWHRALLSDADALAPTIGETA